MRNRSQHRFWTGFWQLENGENLAVGAFPCPVDLAGLALSKFTNSGFEVSIRFELNDTGRASIVGA